MQDTRYRDSPDYKERKSQYMRDYQRKLRELAKTNPEHPRAKRYLEYRKKYQRERHQKLREKALSLFGSKCFLCEVDCKATNTKLELHEIHGKRHLNEHLLKATKNPKDYAPLCIHCHRMVSRMMRVFCLTWQDILALKK